MGKTLTIVPRVLTYTTWTTTFARTVIVVVTGAARAPPVQVVPLRSRIS
jgi:hypothetical protein